MKSEIGLVRCLKNGYTLIKKEWENLIPSLLIGTLGLHLGVDATQKFLKANNTYQTYDAYTTALVSGIAIAASIGLYIRDKRLIKDHSKEIKSYQKNIEELKRKKQSFLGTLEQKLTSLDTYQTELWSGKNLSRLDIKELLKLASHKYRN